jgi:retron-type reverse transcriptase
MFEVSMFKTDQLILSGGTSFDRIRMMAENNPDLVFTSLSHRIDMSLLRSSFRLIKKSNAAGVDKVTAEEYVKDLDNNLCNLYERLRRGQYVAAPVKRIWLEKEDGRMRPIGIPAPEDKIVQKAVDTILNVIYNVNFHDFSHGFRRGHSQHMAFFDNIDKSHLRNFIRQRVNDGGILRLIGKWLNAGVMDEGKTSCPEYGTPRGESFHRYWETFSYIMSLMIGLSKK